MKNPQISWNKEDPQCGKMSPVELPRKHQPSTDACTIPFTFSFYFVLR